MYDSVENSPLKNAMREARLDESFRQDSLYAMRDMEFTRLTVLYEKLETVFADIPPHIDLFDLGLKASEKPRLWIDMIAFVEMNDDRRLYRFYQDTRAKRVLMTETQDVNEMAKTVLDYVARRLIAREQLLAMPFAQPVVLKTTSPSPLQEKVSEHQDHKVDFMTAAKNAAREEAAIGIQPEKQQITTKSRNSFRKFFARMFFIVFILAAMGMVAAKLLQLY